MAVQRGKATEDRPPVADDEMKAVEAFWSRPPTTTSETEPLFPDLCAELVVQLRQRGFAQPCAARHFVAEQTPHNRRRNTCHEICSPGSVAPPSQSPP